MPRLEQLRNELKALLYSEQDALDKLENVQVDIQTVKEEIEQELRVNYSL